MKQAGAQTPLSIDAHERPGFVLAKTHYFFRSKIIEIIRNSRSPLNPEEAWVLMVLDNAGGECRTGDLNQVMQRDPSTLTRQLDTLIEKGLIHRSRDVKDGRVVNVSLSEKGRQELDRVMPDFKALRRDAVKGISEKNYKIMIDGLLKIQENLQTREG